MFIKEVAILVCLTLFDWYCKATREINFRVKQVVPYFMPTENYGYFCNGRNVTSLVNVYFSLDVNPTCEGLLSCMRSPRARNILTIIEQKSWDVNDMKNGAYYNKNTINMVNINLSTKKYIKCNKTEVPVLFGRLDLDAIKNHLEIVHEINTDSFGNIINVEDYTKPARLQTDIKSTESDDELDSLEALEAQLNTK